MAHTISASDFLQSPVCCVADVIAGLKPVSIDDFVEYGAKADRRSALRRTCVANDPEDTMPQSQVDRLISDLMDIIVRAAGTKGGIPSPTTNDAVAEEVALSMMQALLQKQMVSSF
jgi:hypothetical protein